VSHFSPVEGCSQLIDLPLRYRKYLKMLDCGICPANAASTSVPEPSEGYGRADFLPPCRVAPDRVFLCRRVYESRQRRAVKYAR